MKKQECLFRQIIFVVIWCVYTNYLAVLKCYNMMLVYTQVYLYFCYEKYIFLKSTIIENEYKILYTNNLHKSNSECMTNNL